MPSKVGTLLSSRDAVVRLCENKVDELINLTGDAKKNSFEHYIEVCTVRLFMLNKVSKKQKKNKTGEDDFI